MYRSASACCIATTTCFTVCKPCRTAICSATKQSKWYCEWLGICHALSTAWKALACTCIQICCSAPSHSLAQLPQSAPEPDGLQHAACRLVHTAGPALSLPLHLSKPPLHCPASSALQPYSKQIKSLFIPNLAYTYKLGTNLTHTYAH